jgi:pyruvate dehydrogenase E2 component (dihydrolipoyllysine-residue acetyltransferase)
MPSLGADMDEGTIVEWLVKPGDQVHRGDIVAIVETEKSDLDIEVFQDGVVEQLLVPVGLKVAVGTPLAVLGSVVGGSAIEPSTVLPTPAPPVVEPERAEPVHLERIPVEPAPAHAPGHAPVLSPVLRHLADRLHVDLDHVVPSDPAGRIHRDDVERAAALAHEPIEHRTPRVSPRARRLARERGVDVVGLVGTGPEGSVVGTDVLAAPAAAPTAPAVAPAPSGRMSPAERQLARRRAIGELMTKSWQTIPQYHLRQTIDMEHALTWLEQANADAPVEERVLPAALLLRAVAVAAATCKNVNGYWQDDRFEAAEHVNLGVAVALRDGGLLTPSIARADELTLQQLMGELRSLVTHARSGRLRASDTTGATITVTNLGDVGVDEVTGVIFPPQVAIVGFGAVRARPWATGSVLTVRRVLEATLAADHRASDGRVGGIFLATIDRLLQEPEKL